MPLRTAFVSSLAAPLLLATAGGCGHSDEPTPEEMDAWDQAWDDKEGKSDTPSCSGVVVPDRGGFAGRVALTFDDGPNPETTPQVLDVLAAHGIKAAFFVNGNRVTSDATRAIVQRIVDEGHILANHSHSHKNMSQLSIGDVRREIERTHDIIADYGTPTYFRFPFGASTCSTMDVVREEFAQISTGWHVDSADWCYAASRGGVGHCSAGTFGHVPDMLRSDMLAFTMQQVRAKSGGILLFHDIHAFTAEQIEPIIEALKAESFTFVNIDDAATFPLLNGQEDPSGFVGDVCTADDEICDFIADNRAGSCHEFGEDFGFCTLPCEGTCPDRGGYAPTFCVSLDGGGSGACVAQAHARNDDCAAIVGTAKRTRDRYVGSSGAAAASADVCVPADGPTCTGLCNTSEPAPGSSPACYCAPGCVDDGSCCADYDTVCG